MTEPRAHARLSPSSAVRWMTCPGSVRLCESVVDAGSVYANQGTACHAVLERTLNDGGSAKAYTGKEIDVGENGRSTKVMFTAEMAGWVDECVAWVRSYLKSHKGSHLRTEERIIIGRTFGAPDDIWGTSDVVISGPDELVIADAKFGYNEVAVPGNPQLELYTIGVAADYGWVHEKYRMAILQPPCGEPREHVVTRDYLLDAVTRYAPKIKATHDPDAPLVPSDEACHYCAAAGVCPKLQERALALAQHEFASVETLSPNDLSTLLVNMDRIRAGLDAAERHAVKLMMLGQTVPGFKAVAGDKRRVWTNEAGARKVMKQLGYKEDDYEPRKLVTPAQAEKLVGKANANKLSVFIEKPKSDPTLAREDDERPALTPDFTPEEGAPPTIDILPSSTKVLPANTAKGKKSSKK